MARLSDHPIRNRDDLTRFESALSLAQRLPEPSVLDVFIGAAQRWPSRPRSGC